MTEHANDAPAKGDRQQESFFDDINNRNEGKEEQKQSEAKALREISEFRRITLWGHEALPEENDIFHKSMEEWIDFAGALHSHKTLRTQNSRIAI